MSLRLKHSNLDPETVSDTLLTEKTKWRLTQQALDKFLESLDPDRESAGQHYESIRLKLIRFFEWRGCSFPEEHADETIVRMIRKIDAGEEIADLHTYCFGVARLVLLEVFKQQHKEREAIENLPVPPASAEDDKAQERRIECLRGCLQRMPPEQQELISQYYQGGKGEQIQVRQRLAAQLAIPLNALRIRAHRIRESLESCVRKCCGIPK